MVIEIYKREPLAVHDGIPEFSTRDRYTENYEQISADHLKVFEAEGRNPFMDERNWRETEDSTAVLIDRYARPGDLILDVGVGMGRLLERFPKLTRFGMDISDGYLMHARSKGIDVCYARIEDMPYRDCVFDIVTCTDVLEHVLDLNLSFARVMSVVKPGGLLIMRVPYREDLSFYLSPECPYEFVHLRNFDEHSIELLAHKVFGHTVIEQTLAGYRAGRLRMGRSIPKLEGASKLVLDVIERKANLLRGTVGVLRKQLYAPGVINSVIRKTSSTPSAS